MEKEIAKAIEVISTAKRNKKSLKGNGHYSKKFESVEYELRDRARELSGINDPEIRQKLDELESLIHQLFLAENSYDDRLRAASEIRRMYKISILPRLTEAPSHVPSSALIPLEIFENTRGYLEKIAFQACGAFDQHWYDAAAVMCRRLLETLIIECFEAKHLDSKIKDSQGSFLYLKDLIDKMLAEQSWNLSRNTRQALPKLKNLGDLSAHSRRYIAKKPDLDEVRASLRIAVEELIFLAGLK